MDPTPLKMQPLKLYDIILSITFVCCEVEYVFFSVRPHLVIEAYSECSQESKTEPFAKYLRVFSILDV